MISDFFPALLNPAVLFFGCVIAGWIFGLFTGMVPGIHTNNIAAVLAGSAALLYLTGLTPVLICVIILSCAVSHTFHNIIPAIFLGAPGEDTALAVLPGHRLLLAGEGYSAVRLSALGSIGSILISPILMIPMALFLHRFYPVLEPHMGWFLLTLSLIILLSEKELPSILRATFVFLAAGFLGLLAFGLDNSLNPVSVFSETSVLMPLLSGLFGIPQIIISLLTDSEIPNVREKGDSFPSSLLIRNTIIGTAAGAFVSWIPGISSSVAAILAGIFTGKPYPVNFTNDKAESAGETKVEGFDSAAIEETNAKEFIVSVSAISTANAVFGLLAFFILGKSRSGAVVSIRGILSNAGIHDVSLDLFFLFYAVVFLTGFLSYFSTLQAGRRIPKLLQKINYKYLSAFILVFLSSLTFLMTGSYGFVLFLASVFIGFLPVFLGVRKSHLMGVILFPVMLYFLGFR